MNEELVFERIKVETPAQESSRITALDVVWFILYIICICLVCVLVVSFCFQRTVIDGTSMEPTLSENESAIVSKISYTFSLPKRFDIVVFEYDKGNGIHYVKRVIGLPGETVQIKDGYVYINGEKLEGDDYGAKMFNPGIASEPITLADDEYFMLGDNRNESADSRYADVGVIKRSQIVGKVWLRITPLSKFGTVE